MNTFVRVILSVIGYGAYTLAVLVLLLWFLFPVESVRVWLEAKLENQDSPYSWKINSLKIAWPLSVSLTDILVEEKQSGEPLARIDELKMSPDVTGIFRLKNQWPLSYRLMFLGGEVKGTALLEKDMPKVKCSGDIENMEIGDLSGVWQQLGRTVSGKLSGPFSYEGTWNEFLSGNLQADVTLAEGSIELLQPVFGLNSLAFKQMSTSVALQERVATIAQGKIDSNLFAVDFTGTVSLADNLYGSTLDIEGSFEPRPELLGGLKDVKIVQLIKGQLEDDGLQFTLSDTLMEPGIMFQGVSGVIDGIIQGSGR